MVEALNAVIEGIVVFDKLAGGGAHFLAVDFVVNEFFDIGKNLV